jgi:hypothetical protein
MGSTTGQVNRRFTAQAPGTELVATETED